MKKTVLLIAIFALASAWVPAQSGRRVQSHASPPAVVEPEPAKPAPAASREFALLPDSLMNRQFETLDRGRFSLADHAGKVVVLNLWATWCPPCRQETPELDAISREYEARGVTMIGLTVEDPAEHGERVRKFVREAKVSYRIGWISRDAALQLTGGRNVLPQTFVISGEGRLVRRIVGYNPTESAPLLRKAIERALEEDRAVAPRTETFHLRGA